MCLVLATVCGCGYPLATYGPMSASDARGILRQRAEGIKTVSAQADVVLSRSNGQGVQLDAVLVMRPPDSLHLRAWKLGQAVLDLTITPQGAWLMQPPPPSTDGSPAPTTAPASDPFDQPGVGHGLAATWSLLSGGMFVGDAPEMDQARDIGSRFEFRRVQSDGMSVVCDVDKHTITPTQYRLYDADGIQQFELTLDDYANNSGIDWPMKIVARQLGTGQGAGSANSIEVDFHKVELNTDLPDGAFVPPRRARKLP